MKIKEYSREKAVGYAKTWALRRNPKYYNFDKLGGDCTNFVSQCLYAGSGIMNFKKDSGWYYRSLSDRAPAWTGVEFLYNFLITNNRFGPFAVLTEKENLKLGDVIELGKANGDFFHTLLVTQIDSERIYVSSHTRDFYNVPLEIFSFYSARFLSIKGVYV